jgi:2-methylisocitrate lyase-like PEP mutase family enzyme
VPNPWDAGAARLLEHLGFEGLATTSSGFAGTQGHLDGDVTRADVLAHAAALVEATSLPISADLEDGYAVDLDGVAETYRLAIATGLCGASIEDFTRHPDPHLFPIPEAVARVEAAADAVRASGIPFVLTARSENALRGNVDLADTIARLQAYQEAGADVLFAPGWSDPEDIRAIVTSVDRPVNVLLRDGGPSVAELGELGARRVSVGGSLYWIGLAAVTAAAEQLRDQGTLPGAQVAAGVTTGRAAFGRG